MMDLLKKPRHLDFASSKTSQLEKLVISCGENLFVNFFGFHMKDKMSLKYRV